MSPIKSSQNTASTVAPALQAAADAAAALVPATSPLVATPAPAGAAPPPEATAIVVSVVGAVSAELALVAADAVVEAVEAGAAAGAPIALADALTPALSAAAEALGPGAVEPARTEQVAAVVGADTQVFQLRTAAADSTDVAWFTVRLRGEQVRAPEPEPTAQGLAPGVPTPRQGSGASITVLYDVEMTLTAELGRTRLPLRQVLDLAPGAVLELDRTAGSPADVMVNGRLIARGEVVVVDEDYGLRITEIVAGSEGQG
ncbi:MAG: flagellar motor switch protein FliN [Cellulomonas sp.]|jgi:flagellar motor switch protein FliN/FliY|nr:flagellar motor switch protein FliN [Cellulomonas sp.]